MKPVDLGNHKTKDSTCLESFSGKDLGLGSYDGFLQLLSISQQFSIDIFLNYRHRLTNREVDKGKIESSRNISAIDFVCRNMP